MKHLLQSQNPPLQILQLTRPPPRSQSQWKWTCKLSRRDLAVTTLSSTPFLLLSTFFSSSPSLANGGEAQSTTTSAEADLSTTTTNTTNAEADFTTTTNNNNSNAEADPTTTTGNTDAEFAAATGNAEAEPSATTTSNAVADPSTTTKDSCTEKPVTKKAFLDVSIDGQPAGRIVVGLYGDSTPFGTSRFAALASGAAGISYRRKEFVKILSNYVQHGGVRSYGVDAELATRTGSDLAADSLLAEWETSTKSCPGTKNVAGALGIVIRDPAKPPPKLKLVARKGKLVIDEEEVGVAPNGTEFVIAVKDSPELDESTLVVGRVLDGMDVVEKISQVKTVKENTSSPYFRVAKLIGDKRAVVAERGFNRPYSRVLVTNCGLLD